MKNGHSKHNRFEWLSHRYWLGLGALATIIIGGATLVQAGVLGPHTSLERGATPTTATPITSQSDSPLAASPTTSTRPSTVKSVLPYQADWSSGMGGWTASTGWATVSGMLVNDGTNNSTAMSAVAPDLFAGIGDYSVEADIQLVRAALYQPSFGFVTRASSDKGGYGVGFWWNSGPGYNLNSAVIWQAQSGAANPIGKTPFDPSSSWHHYVVTMRGNTISEVIDGGVVLNVSDNTYLAGGRIGLWSDRAQINVKNFRVTSP